MARIPNQALINLRNTFGVDPQFLLSDLNDYTMEGPENDVIPIDDGIASIDTGLPMYRQDGNNNRFLQYSGSGSPYSSQPNDLLNNFFAATRERTENLNNPNKIQGLINSGITKIGMDPQRSIVEMIKSGQVDEKKFRGIPSVSGILAQILPDKYYDMSLEDQVFTQANMGYDGPTVFGKNTGNQDIFGINVRSGLGNYAEAVQESFDNLDNQLSGRLAEKYGATFNKRTGKFEGPGAERANQMTKMMRFKYGVQENQLANKKIIDAQIKKIRERKAKEAEALANATKQYTQPTRSTQQAIREERGDPGSSDYGNPGGTSGAMTEGPGGNVGTYCFDPSTPIQMADGSTKKIKEIQLGDDTKGGEVTGVFQFKATDEIHDYKGVTVAGSHYVKEDGRFIMVKDSPLSVKIDKIPVVYSLDTSGRRIFINDIEFADYNGDGIAKGFLANAGVDITGFDTEVLRQVENRLI